MRHRSASAVPELFAAQLWDFWNEANPSFIQLADVPSSGWRLFILLNYKYCGHNLREQ